MSLMNHPTCDICGGIDIGDVCIPVYDTDSHEDMMACPDCLELYGDHLREPGERLTTFMK